MKNKGLVIGVVLAAVVIIVGLVFMSKPSKRAAKEAVKPAAGAKAAAVKAGAKPAAAAPAKRPIKKGMGALTVKLLGSRGREINLRLKAFRASDARSSVYTATFYANRMYELAPGNYDIEIETIPQKLFKNIRVVADKETVEDLGSITGSLEVKALNSKNKGAAYPVRIYPEGSGTMIATTTMGRPVELSTGVYDIELGVLPKAYEKKVKIESGREKVLDLGALTGALTVKAVDENKAEKRGARISVRIRKSDNNELVTTTIAGRAIELRQGTYDVELLTSPVQAKKGVKVNAGTEQAVDIVVPAQPAAAMPKVAAPPAKVNK